MYTIPMLSIFPSILFLAPISALLIRIAVTVVLAIGAWKHFADARIVYRSLAILEIITAVAIAAGASTQIAAIVAVLIIAAWLYSPSLLPFAKEAALLSLVLCISLILTGAGAFAIDLPL